MIESGYQRRDIARVWKFGTGNLAPLAEGADNQGEPDVPSLVLCSEGKIGKHSRSSYIEKKRKKRGENVWRKSIGLVASFLKC